MYHKYMAKIHAHICERAFQSRLSLFLRWSMAIDLLYEIHQLRGIIGTKIEWVELALFETLYDSIACSFLLLFYFSETRTLEDRI